MSIWTYFLQFALFVVSLFLILLVLVQRGRGGGLAGALGGMGGQSAFGSKAGDVFTRITIAVAALWILLCMFTIVVVSRGRGPIDPTLGGGRATTKAEPQAGEKPGKTGDAPGAGGPVVPAGSAAPLVDEDGQPAAASPAAASPAATTSPTQAPSGTDAKPPAADAPQ